LRSGNGLRTYTGAFLRGDSSRPRSQDFKTAPRDPPSWRSMRA